MIILTVLHSVRLQAFRRESSLSASSAKCGKKPAGEGPVGGYYTMKNSRLKRPIFDLSPQVKIVGNYLL
jgi:hypothetical protein